MRLAAIMAALFACGLTFAASSSPASAAALDPSEIIITKNKTAVMNLLDPAKEEAESADPGPVKHVVAESETLYGIAVDYETSWQRLYAKNTHIADPDLINIGQEVTIPDPDEEIEERPVPVREEPVAVSERSASQAEAAAQAVQSVRQNTMSRGSSAGNTYYYGYCTWYAKEKRPDLPNNLGNANTWVSRARAQGIPTGSAPRVGAIGQQGMHVVYVERVNGDGTVFISEMNFRGYGVVSTRTVSAGNFMYIY